MKDAEIVKLVHEAVVLDLECKEKYKRLSDIKRDLLAAAESRPKEYQSGAKGGRHWIFETDKAQVTVTFPDPSLSPDTDSIEQVRKVAGIAFGKLFDRVVTHKPVKSFRDVLAALLTPAKVSKILALCEKTSAPKVALKLR